MAPRKRRDGKRLLSQKEVDDTIKLVVSRAKKEGVRIALLGGAAMNFYGSPRLTSDVDFVAENQLESADNFVFLTKLSFGGDRYMAPGEIPVDAIVRDDEQSELYEAALDAADETDEGFLIVSPEYLAAIKFGAQRGKDQDDLLWLLSQKGVVDKSKALEIVKRHLGGSFAANEFKQAIYEARWRAKQGEYKDKSEVDDSSEEE